MTLVESLETRVRRLEDADAIRRLKARYFTCCDRKDPQGVRVNSIHPAGANTAMSNPAGAPLEEINNHYANVPLQRVGLPDEIARATLLLASDEASYCNAAELAVDGGMAAGAYYPGLPGAPF